MKITQFFYGKFSSFQEFPWNLPQIHFLAVNLVLVEIEEIDGARHALAAILHALHHVTVVVQPLQQPRHRRHERAAHVNPRRVVRLQALQNSTPKIASEKKQLRFA